MLPSSSKLVEELAVITLDTLDIVVIELDRNINFEFEIFPVCLPKIATVDRNSRKGQTATVTGTVYKY